jgi:hypothetical protein
MQGNESKFAFIYFYFLFRIGTFQWVAREKNIKISPPPGSRIRLWANGSNSHSFSSSRRHRRAGTKFCPQKCVAQISDFVEKMSSFLFAVGLGERGIPKIGGRAKGS